MLIFQDACIANDYHNECFTDNVSQFNKHQQCPDVQREEWMASFIQDSYSAGEVGYRYVVTYDALIHLIFIRILTAGKEIITYRTCWRSRLTC